MNMKSVAGESGEGLGHEGSDLALALSQHMHHVAKKDQPVSGGQGIGVLPVLLKLAVGIFVVICVIAPPRLAGEYHPGNHSAGEHKYRWAALT